MDHATVQPAPQASQRRETDLATLCEIGEVLNSSLELDEVLNIILIGLTAGQGLRFNRAFLLLVDERAGRLRGRLALGPDSPEEAERIWKDPHHRHLGLREMLEKCSRHDHGTDGRVARIVASIDVPMEDERHVLVRALRDKAARVIARGEQSDPTSDHLADLLGVDRFALLPVLSRRGPVGVLIADNAVTGRPIDEADLDILRLFANYAGTAIERARLHARLREEKDLLQLAHEELRANQQTIIGLQRLSDLGEMAARVAHEIRNPLVMIGGFARRMLETTPVDDLRRRPLQIIVSEVSRLEGIITEVLDFARPLTLNAVPTSVNDLVREVLEVMTPEREPQGVEMAAELDGSCPEIVADEGLLRIAFLNLMRNAVQSVTRETGRRGRVRVRTRNMGTVVEVAVEDNGDGIPAEVAHRILEPFFTTKPSGSGLGLAIVSQIMKEHGGRVRFESPPGQGATFFLDIPLRKGAET